MSFASGMDLSFDVFWTGEAKDSDYTGQVLTY